MRKSVFLLMLALTAAWLTPVGLAQQGQQPSQPPSQQPNPLPGHFPTKGRFVREFAGPGGAGSNLRYNGGPVMTKAYVVPIYWGSNWNSGADSGIATSLTNYIGTATGGFGQTGEYNTITQYYQVSGGVTSYISKSNLGSVQPAIYDGSNPPTNVTDADIQAEVLFVTNNNPRSDTVYEVFLPATSYSSSGSSTSCGGPNLQYCAYHGHFKNGLTDVKYASMPYPSCGGCQTSGFSTAQNFEHFISHETREAVTDEDLNAWYDRRGYEADDKCAWSPTPFTDALTGTNSDGTAFAYQYEWSNANSGCVKTR